MTDRTELPAPAELILDVFVFAPIGLLCDFPRIAPAFLSEPIEAFTEASREGHRRLDATNDRVHHTVERRVQQVQRAIDGLGLGIELPEWLPHGPGPEASIPAPAGVSAPLVVATPADAVVAPEAAEAATPAVPAPSGDTLAIPDYESLSASQVVPRLESLAPEELEAIRRFEHAHRGRKTILNKIAQLQEA